MGAVQTVTCPPCQYPIAVGGFKNFAKGRGAVRALYIGGILAGQRAGAVNCMQKTGKDGTRYEASETPFETTGTPFDAGALHAPHHR